MSSKLVSILIPAYNHENYVQETIKSAINQTYQNIELIIIDDGSKDTTWQKICEMKEECEKRFVRVHFETKENEGTCATLNKLIKKAQGDYIYMVASDDVVPANAIEEEVKFLDKNLDYAFVVGRNPVIDNNSQRIYWTKNREITRDINEAKYVSLDDFLSKYRNFDFNSSRFGSYKELYLNENHMPNGYLIRKSIFDKIGPYTKEAPLEDYWMMLQISKFSKMKYLNNVDTCYYRWHESNTMQNGSKIRFMTNKTKEYEKTQIKKYNLFSLKFNVIFFILYYFYIKKILKFIYSKQKLPNKRIYKIMGIKITTKKRPKKKNFININEQTKQILQAIRNKETQYVSFDIFDTLLVRPCIKPSDIFHLIAQKVDNLYNINFVSLRLNAEVEMNNPYASIQDIYEFIAKEYNLNHETAMSLMNEEIEIESKLLYVREDAKLFYDEAIKQSKKIIAISDMYLPSDVLKKILENNGYTNIEKIYVSNEYKARKDTSLLYKIVCDDLKTNKFVHIGDNLFSDYTNAKKYNIKAFYYPKTIEILKNKNNLFLKLINNLQKSQNHNQNIFMGYVLNKYYFNSLKYQNAPNDLNIVIDMFLFPFTCYTSLFIQRNAMIQSLYNKVFFAARDGYLFQKVYDILNKDKKYLDSQYIYASRRAYMPGAFRNFYELLWYTQNTVKEQYTLYDFIKANILNEDNKQKILEKLGQYEQDLSIKLQSKECYRILKQFENILKNEYELQKNNAIAYYKEVLDKNRNVVFDIGYSGSISEGIQNLTGITIDKIYVSESYKNIQKDNKYKTYTFIIKNAVEQKKYKWTYLMLEELCSPLTGSCAGFEFKNNKYIPKLDSLEYTPAMQEIFHDIEKRTIENTNDIINLFGPNIHYLNVLDILPLSDFITEYFITNKNAKQIFSKIVFPDLSYRHKSLSLCEKINI